MKKTFILLFVVLLFIPNMVLAFNDVPYESPNYDAINYAQFNGIVEGYEDGTFRPEQEINRAEMIKIVVEYTVDDAEITGSNCFNDVKDDWYAKYVCTAKNKGIVVGYPDGSFKPEQTINFVEASKLVVKGFDYSTEEDSNIWYRPYVRFLTNKRTVPQTIKHLDSVLTRGELAEILYRVNINTQNEDGKLSEDFPTMVYYDGGDLRMLLENGYAVDAEYVYYNGKVIEGADPTTFESFVGEYIQYGHDSVHAYHRDLLIEGADGATFDFVSYDYTKDKNNVYMDVDFEEWDIEILEGADPATFELMDHNNAIYAKDANHIYMGFGGRLYERISDVNTFEFIEGTAYSKDKDYVFVVCFDKYFHEVVKGADPETFEFLGSWFGKDKEHAYHGTEMIVDSDPSTFEVLEHSYSKDQYHAYQYEKTIIGADPATFEALGHAYSKDKNNVYIHEEILEGEDPETFVYPY